MKYSDTIIIHNDNTSFCLFPHHPWLQYFFTWFFSPLAHHAVVPGVDPWHGGALWGVSVAEAAPSDRQLVEGIVIFLQDVEAPVQQVVSQSVQLGEVDTQVGDTQEFCKKKKKRLFMFHLISFQFHDQTDHSLVCKHVSNDCFFPVYISLNIPKSYQGYFL